MVRIFKKIDYDKLSPKFRRFVNICLGWHPFGYPYKKLKIIGVTGTNGKTTTTTLLYRVAKSLGYKVGLIGTVENFIDDKEVSEDFYTKGSFLSKIFYTSSPTTPEIWELNKLLSEMVKEGCEYVFMEITSHGTEEKRVNGIQFIGGLFTNLTQDHLDYHKSMDKYFLAKKKFFEMLPKQAFALTNADDERGKSMLEGVKARCMLYGFDQCQRPSLTNECQGRPLTCFCGKIRKSDFDGLELDFNGSVIKSKLIGAFNAYNLLSVWSVCELLGFDVSKVKKVLENIEPPKGRFDHFMSDSGVLAIVDYAHTPDALEKVLLTVREVKPRENKTIAVFGCGGDRDTTKRPKMGNIGVALSDVPIFTSDNPRSEDPNKIISDMAAELFPDDLKKIKMIADRREAIKEAVRIAKKGDVIICAGKGHEDYQETNGVKSHFDDMEELRLAFKK